MCAIFGMGLLNNHKLTDNDLLRNMIRSLFMESKARGRDASGVVYASSREYVVLKNDMPADKFINLSEYDATEEKYLALTGTKGVEIAKAPPRIVIGHCRAQTKGSARNNKNNHPIIRDSIIGVHNGVVINDDIIFNRYTSSFKRNGEVDSESIFALIEYYVNKEEKPIHSAVRKMASVTSGSMSCAFVMRHVPYIVCLFKRTAPCDVLLFEDVGLLMWSSSKDYILDSVKACDGGKMLGAPKEIDYPRGSGMCIDLHRNLLNRFIIDNGL